MKYLTIDTELTSGRPAREGENTLLTLYMGIIENKKLIDDLDLKLIPDNGLFTVDPESMGINGIDLRNWEGVTYKEGRTLVDTFIRKYVYNERREKVAARLRAVGQGVSGDIKVIQHHLITKDRWESAVERVPVDTLQYATILQDAGYLEGLESLSLKSLAEYFGLDITGLHTAKADGLLHYEVFEKLKNELLRYKENSNYEF